jgi:hypothetical protein
MAERHHDKPGRYTAAIERLLGATAYGDYRPPYRNMKTGKLSFPVKSELEVKAALADFDRETSEILGGEDGR